MPNIVEYRYYQVVTIVLYLRGNMDTAVKAEASARYPRDRLYRGGESVGCLTCPLGV